MARTLARKGRGTEAPLSVQLRESGVMASAPFTSDRVDEANGIIRGVKILGNESPNIPPDMPGVVHGTRYPRGARERAKKLYEGAKSNKNHAIPNRSNPYDSNPDKRNGWFTNVVVTDEGTFGDYNLLLSDPLTPKLLEAAKRNPNLFSMSHDAYAKGKVVDGWFVVDDIVQVDSIDVVADGGTNVSLFESRQQGRQPMKMTFRKLLESSTNPAVKAFVSKSHVVRLLEMDGLGESVLDAPAPEDEPAMGWKEHLGEMLKAIVADESMSPEDLKKKVNAALKLLEEGGKDEGDKTIDTGDDDSGDDDDDTEGETKESLANKVKRLEDLADCRRLCESEGLLNATQDDVESVQAMPTPEKRKWLIGTLKLTKTQTKAPQSQGPGTKVRESKAAETQQPAPFQPLLRG